MLRRRFSETRRPHPLAHDKPVDEGIRRERELLGWLRERADLALDTSRLSVRDLRSLIAARFQPEAAHAPAIFVLSFAYRHGVPPEADFVFDVRFLANPHHVPALQPLTGREAEVARYVREDPAYAPFFDGVVSMLRPLLPAFERDGRSYLTIALGCTGGRHRSVAVAEHLAQEIGGGNWQVTVRHRDLDAEPAAWPSKRTDEAMIGLVLVTHGRLAQEFVAATEHVVGPQTRTCAICIGPDDDMEQRRQDILDAIGETDEGDGVIVLTDMFGGTPSNLAISVMESANVEVIAGVNLPMLIKLASVRSGSDLRSAVAAAQEAGRTYIHVAGRLLEGGET